MSNKALHLRYIDRLYYSDKLDLRYKMVSHKSKLNCYPQSNQLTRASFENIIYPKYLLFSYLSNKAYFSTYLICFFLFPTKVSVNAGFLKYRKSLKNQEHIERKSWIEKPITSTDLNSDFPISRVRGYWNRTWNTNSEF